MPLLDAALRSLDDGCRATGDAYRAAAATLDRGYLRAVVEDLAGRREATAAMLAPHLARRGKPAEESLSARPPVDPSPRAMGEGPRVAGLVERMLEAERRLLDRCAAALAASTARDPVHGLLVAIEAEQAALVDAVESLLVEA